jgi:hypothetical protein
MLEDEETTFLEQYDQSSALYYRGVAGHDKEGEDAIRLVVPAELEFRAVYD